MVFLEILQNSEKKHLCQNLFFNKVAGLRSATLLKKKLWNRGFPVHFAKFLRTLFLTENLWWLLLNNYSLSILTFSIFSHFNVSWSNYSSSWLVKLFLLILMKSAEAEVSDHILLLACSFFSVGHFQIFKFSLGSFLYR